MPWARREGVQRAAGWRKVGALVQGVQAAGCETGLSLQVTKHRRAKTGSVPTWDSDATELGHRWGHTEHLEQGVVPGEEGKGCPV